MSELSEKSRFIEGYVQNFLGSYAAQNYVRNCQNGWPEGSKKQPIEDAIELAKEAWGQIVHLRSKGD